MRSDCLVFFFVFVSLLLSFFTYVECSENLCSVLYITTTSTIYCVVQKSLISRSSERSFSHNALYSVSYMLTLDIYTDDSLFTQVLDARLMFVLFPVTLQPNECSVNNP